LTEDDSLPPSDPNDFTIDCATPNAQNINYTLTDTTTQGTRVFRLWAIDSTGNISSTASTVSITFDNQAPVVSSVLVNDGATYAATSILSVKVNMADNFTAQPEVRLALANTGTSSCQSE